MPTFIEWFALSIVIAALIVVIAIAMYKTGKDEGKAEAESQERHNRPTPV